MLCALSSVHPSPLYFYGLTEYSGRVHSGLHSWPSFPLLTLTCPGDHGASG